jgi:hypothetical protein
MRMRVGMYGGGLCAGVFVGVNVNVGVNVGVLVYINNRNTRHRHYVQQAIFSIDFKFAVSASWGVWVCGCVLCCMCVVLCCVCAVC